MSRRSSIWRRSPRTCGGRCLARMRGGRKINSLFSTGRATSHGIPDASFVELRRLCGENERLRAPEKVFNALLNRTETV